MFVFAPYIIVLLIFSPIFVFNFLFTSLSLFLSFPHIFIHFCITLWLLSSSYYSSLNVVCSTLLWISLLCKKRQRTMKRWLRRGIRQIHSRYSVSDPLCKIFLGFCLRDMSFPNLLKCPGKICENLVKSPMSRNHEVAGTNPAVIRCCCELQCRSQMWLRSD